MSGKNNTADIEKTTRSMWKWFWAWEDEREEQWLAEMAARGWHLKSLGFPGRYTFEQGEPREVAYRLDFKFNPDMDSYTQLFADAGWEYVDNYGCWMYFRKAVGEAGAEEIYTDVESKKTKYRAVLTFLALVLIGFSFFGRPRDIGGTVYIAVTTVFYVAFMLVMVYAAVRVLRRLQELDKKL